MPEAPGDWILVELSRAGDENAARQLFDEYVGRLLDLARRHISHRLASRVDPEDVVQSVFRTFFVRVKAGRFHITDENDLAKLLARITVRKTLRQINFHRAAKRDPFHETEQKSWSREELLTILTREPSAEVTLAFLDQLEHLLHRLRPEERQILQMRLQDYTNEEIASQLGIYERKVRRVLERVRHIAEQEGLAPSSSAE